MKVFRLKAKDMIIEPKLGEVLQQWYYFASMPKQKEHSITAVQSNSTFSLCVLRFWGRCDRLGEAPKQSL